MSRGGTPGGAVRLRALQPHLAADLDEGTGRSRGEQLLDDVWGYDTIPFTRTVDTHIAKLRKKIERLDQQLDRQYATPEEERREAAVASFNSQLASLDVERGRLGERFKAGHPEMQEVLAQIEQLRMARTGRANQILEEIQAEYGLQPLSELLGSEAPPAPPTPDFPPSP